MLSCSACTNPLRGLSSSETNAKTMATVNGTTNMASNSFAIGWKGQYRIQGTAFIYADRDSERVRTILGFPTQKIARAG